MLRFFPFTICHSGCVFQHPASLGAPTLPNAQPARQGMVLRCPGSALFDWRTLVVRVKLNVAIPRVVNSCTAHTLFCAGR
jgi:hypothetical protein